MAARISVSRDELREKLLAAVKTTATPTASSDSKTYSKLFLAMALFCFCRHMTRLGVAGRSDFVDIFKRHLAADAEFKKQIEVLSTANLKAAGPDFKREEITLTFVIREDIEWVALIWDRLKATPTLVDHILETAEEWLSIEKKWFAHLPPDRMNFITGRSEYAIEWGRINNELSVASGLLDIAADEEEQAKAVKEYRATLGFLAGMRIRK